MQNSITVRDAVEDDIPALTAIKGDGSQAVHHDRLRDAREGGFRYLVLIHEEQVTGYACLVFRRPAYWSDGGDTEHLPQIVDLQVKEGMRSRGYGSTFIRSMEHIAAAAGCADVYVSVEPLDNPRALALYQRLGFEPVQAEPYQRPWQFNDSAGRVHRGEEWIIDMVKHLRE